MFDINLYISSFILGLLGSTHCIGMCGSILQLFQNMSPVNKVGISLYIYNFGRLTSYMIITLVIVGLLFSFMDLAKSIMLLTKSLRIITGLLIIYLGVSKLFTIKLPVRLTNIGQGIWLKIRKLANPIMPPKNLLQVYIIGIIWGFIPCGLIYSAVAVSAGASNMASSLITVLLFGVGTMPALIGVGMLSTKLKQNKNSQAILAVLLICMGIFTLATIG